MSWQSDRGDSDWREDGPYFADLRDALSWARACNRRGHRPSSLGREHPLLGRPGPRPAEASALGRVARPTGPCCGPAGLTHSPTNRICRAAGVMRRRRTHRQACPLPASGEEVFTRTNAMKKVSTEKPAVRLGKAVLHRLRRQWFYEALDEKPGFSKLRAPGCQWRPTEADVPTFVPGAVDHLVGEVTATDLLPVGDRMNGRDHQPPTGPEGGLGRWTRTVRHRRMLCDAT